MLPNESGDRKPESGKFAVVLNGPGRFAPTDVAGFRFLPGIDRHVWKGKVAESMGELAGQVNEALEAVAAFCDPFMTISVVPTKPETGERKPEREEELVHEANGMLLNVIQQNGGRGPGRLKVLETKGALA